jgi:UDP-perosamine 4-acetyltransferase
MDEGKGAGMKHGIVVVGGGGHAKVCIEILRAQGEEISYCVGGHDAEDVCAGVRVLKGDENLLELHKQGYGRAFVAVGSNRLRQRLADSVLKQGFEIVRAIHPRAIISESVHIEYGVAVMAGVVINAEARIGALAIINTGATIDHDCQIGRAVHIAPQCGLAGNVKVGDRSFLGVGSKVIPNVHIGDDVIVGAGGVVINDLESKQTVVGVPARPLK